LPIQREDCEPPGCCVECLAASTMGTVVFQSIKTENDGSAVPGGREVSRRHIKSRLDQRFGPVLERFLHFMQKLVGDGAIDDAMVVAQRDVTHGADGDGIVDHHRALFDGPEAEDADIRLADHRQSEESAEDSRIGDREGAFLDFLGLEFFRTRALGKIVQIALDAEKVFLVGALDDGGIVGPSESLLL